MNLTPEYYAVLLPFLAGPQTSDDPPAVYRDLEACGWIEAVGLGTSTHSGVTQLYDNCWAITPQGRMALQTFKYTVDHDAKEEKQNRTANNLAKVNIVVSLVSFIAGLLVDHYLGIISLVSTLLQK